MLGHQSLTARCQGKSFFISVSNTVSGPSTLTGLGLLWVSAGSAVVLLTVGTVETQTCLRWASLSSGTVKVDCLCRVSLGWRAEAGVCGCAQFPHDLK